MVTIRNINPDFGDCSQFTASTLELAVSEMQSTIRDCGVDFADTTVDEADYEIIDQA